MIFKILPPAASFHGIEYNEKKQKTGKAATIYWNHFGYLHGQNSVTKEELKKYLKDYSARNTRIQKPQFHAVLSCQGNTHSFEELKDLSIQIMQQLGYKEIPMLIYEHRDTNNNHVHIITSRVGIDGKKISDHNEGKRSHTILNNLLKLNPSQLFEEDLRTALQ